MIPSQAHLCVPSKALLGRWTLGSEGKEEVSVQQEGSISSNTQVLTWRT